MGADLPQILLSSASCSFVLKFFFSDASNVCRVWPQYKRRNSAYSMTENLSKVTIIGREAARGRPARFKKSIRQNRVIFRDVNGECFVLWPLSSHDVPCQIRARTKVRIWLR